MMDLGLVITVHTASNTVKCTFTRITVAVVKTMLTLPNNARGDGASKVRVASPRVSMALNEF